MKNKDEEVKVLYDSISEKDGQMKKKDGQMKKKDD
jgi:hypothetical protein